MGRAIRITGTLLALSFIGVLILRQAPNLPPLDVTSPALWAGLSVGLFLYVLSQVIAAEAWRAILLLSEVRIAPGLARGQPMVSQIGKYIPGNVAHLFGRVALGRQDGVPGSILAASMVLEVGVTLGVGLGVAGAFLLVRPEVIPNLAADYPDLGTRLLPVAVAALLAIGLGIGAILLRSRLRALDAPRPGLSQLAKPLTLLVASFLLLGVSLWATTLPFAADTAPDLVACTLIFAFAWAAGFVMPGAPGGIGVRDSIIVLGLAASVGDGSALAIALLHRGVSVIGDLVTFATGLLMRRGHAAGHPKNKPKPAIFASD
ncbi:hypothetical protein AB2B41_13590 [Marimonas sp. MJW-29]|uniref:Flippase-like domain-containing protein n=1 Tax=Sulfitobacter sediminis TaxID=3234186 RepID=A0ABV3RNU5_9RHOB